MTLKQDCRIFGSQEKNDTGTFNLLKSLSPPHPQHKKGSQFNNIYETTLRYLCIQAIGRINILKTNVSVCAKSKLSSIICLMTEFSGACVLTTEIWGLIERK